MSEVLVIAGDRLARYGFGSGHPFGLDRHAAFYREFVSRGLERRCRIEDTRRVSAVEGTRLDVTLTLNKPVRSARLVGRGATKGTLELQATPDRPEALLVGHVPAASGTYELVFEDVKVPVENRLGEEGEGFKIAMQTLNKTRIPVAAGSVGVARRALDEARKYAKERQAFGQPIANFQAIQFKLADMLIGIETARMYTYYAAWLADQGLPHAHASAIAKAYASEIAFEAANQAIQIHGGYGYVREFPVEKLLRDVKLNQIYEGTNEIQRLIIARHILAE